MTSDGKQFIVEIYVTHAVDDEKKAKIKSMMISAVEIDISHLKGLMIDKETLQQEISNPENYSWLLLRNLTILLQEHLWIILQA